MRPSTLLAILSSYLLAAAAQAQPPVSFVVPAGDLSRVERQLMPPMDNVGLTAGAEARERQPAVPYQFAEPIAVTFSSDLSGTWERLDDGSRLWRLRIHSPGAVNLNLAFGRFELPAGARLWLYAPDGGDRRGPYTARHRNAAGQLWTPIVGGDEVVVELHVPAGSPPAYVVVSAVNHGFRGLKATKQDPCNIDVVCPEGNPWRDQIRSVATFSFGGLRQCSGQLINNTAQDQRPLFLSAFHCNISAGNAGTMVFYWNFESPTCGQLGNGNTSQTQVGAIFRSGFQPTDHVLVELQQAPDPTANVFFTGWDRSGQVPQSTVSIHHPNTDEKAISFDNDPAVLSTFPLVMFGGPVSWEVVWDAGTTEGGSSGSCLFDAQSKLCVGQLWGGFAACSDPGERDWYGQLSLSWTGGGTDSTRLSNWLDPLGTGATTLQGLDSSNGPTGCVPSGTNLCLADGRFKVELDWAPPNGPGGAANVVQGVGSDDSGLFYFVNPNNWEMLIKVLDNCNGPSNRFWVFAAATTTLEYTLTVTDTQTNEVKTYENLPGVSSPAITDTQAFATCP